MQARHDTPLAIAWHPDNSLLIADNANYRVRRVDIPTGLISTIAGTGTLATPVSGTSAVSSSVTHLYEIEVAANGDIYIGDSVAQVWEISFTMGEIVDIPGAVPLTFNTLGGVAPIGSDQLYVGDFLGYRVYHLSVAGALTAVAGTGNLGDTGDGGDALSAELAGVAGLATNRDGDLLVISGARVRMVLSP